MNRLRTRLLDLGVSVVTASAVAAMAFRYFIVHGKTMIWSSDGVGQHYPSLYFFNDWVRTFLHHPGQGLPLWSWTIGLGADVIGSLSFYVVGDPFALISLAFPMRHLELAYNVALIARILCAAVFSAMYLRRMGARNVPALTGALLYTFSGFVLCNGARHPFFVTAVVALPLLLMAAEHAVHARRAWPLTAIVFVSAISNFYFFYILTIVTVLYLVARYFEITPLESRWKRLVPTGARIAGFYTLGVMLAAPLLIPAIQAIGHTARSQVSYSFGLLYSWHEYRAILSDLVSSQSSTHFSFMGFSFVGLALVPVLFARRGNRALKFLLIAYAAFISLPVFGSLFNGFTFPLGRFSFSLGIFLALTLSVVLSQDRPFTRREVRAMAIGYAIVAVLVLALCEPLDTSLVAALVIGLLVVLVATLDAISPRRVAADTDASSATDSPLAAWRAPLVQWALLGLVVVNIAMNSAVLYEPEFKHFGEEFADRGTVRSMFINDSNAMVRRITSNSVSRVDDRDVASYNASLVQRFRGTSVYLSVLDGGVSKLRSELGVGTQVLPSISLGGFDDRAALEALVSAEYFVTRRDAAQFVPYGFTPIDSSADAIAYRSEHTLPLGFVYQAAIARSDYDALDPLGKQSALLQGAVVEDGVAPNVTRVAPNREAIEVAYTVVAAQDATLDAAAGTITRTASGGSITLACSRVPDSELYVSLLDFTNEIDPPSQSASATVAETGWQRVATTYADLFRQEPWRIYTEYGVKGRTKAQLWHTPHSPYSWGRPIQVVNLGYSKLGENRVKISFQGAGTLTFRSLRLSAVPMRGFPARVATLKRAGLRDIEVGTDRVTGTATSTGPGLVFLSIPFSDGWSATVDGVPTAIAQVNTAFLGVPVDAGKHRIVLRYETPGLRAGLAVFGVALLLILGVALADVLLARRGLGSP